MLKVATVLGFTEAHNNFDGLDKNAQKIVSKYASLCDLAIRYYSDKTDQSSNEHWKTLEMVDGYKLKIYDKDWFYSFKGNAEEDPILSEMGDKVVGILQAIDDEFEKKGLMYEIKGEA